MTRSVRARPHVRTGMGHRACGWRRGWRGSGACDHESSNTAADEQPRGEKKGGWAAPESAKAAPMWRVVGRLRVDDVVLIHRKLLRFGHREGRGINLSSR